MKVCFLMVEKALSGFVTNVTLGPYSVNEHICCSYSLLVYRS